MGRRRNYRLALHHAGLMPCIFFQGILLLAFVITKVIALQNGTITAWPGFLLWWRRIAPVLNVYMGISEAPV